MNGGGGKIILSHGTSSARGIGVFIRKELFSSISNIYVEEDGRLIAFDIEEGNYKITVVAIYAPNEDSPGFFRALGEILRERHEHKIIVGDFNLTMNVELDRLNTYHNNSKARNEVENLMVEFCLKDVWRDRNESRREYSWYKRGSLQKASRIDFALVSGGLDQRVELIQYLSSTMTDHRAVYMVVKPSPHERGAGYWKLNCSFLKQQEYVEKMNTELERCVKSVLGKEPIDAWEIIKTRIKKVSMEYARCKASEDSLIIAQLSESINSYEASLPLPYREDQILAQSKQDLEEKLLEKVKGTIFRSKVKWFEEGERNTKYFFSLEKARYNAKTYIKMIDEDQREVTHPQQILQCQREYYRKLYDVDGDVNFSMKNCFEIFVSEEVRKEQVKQIVPKDLECAIKTMNNNKTPGEDGIPVDFYKVFWSKIKVPFCAMVITVYEQNVLHESARKGVLNLIPKANKDTRLKI